MREPARDRRPGGRLAVRHEECGGVGEPLLELGVRAAVGEVQVAEQLGRVGLAGQFVEDAVHPLAVPFDAGLHRTSPSRIFQHKTTGAGDKAPRPDVAHPIAPEISSCRRRSAWPPSFLAGVQRFKIFSTASPWALKATIAGVVCQPCRCVWRRTSPAGRDSGGSGDVASARFTDDVWSAVRAFAPDLVCFAGWLHLLPIPADFRHRVLNIHPALLPAFGGKGMYGRHVHEAVLAAGAKVSGCTVHFADDSYDTGPILVQKCVPVKEGDDAEHWPRRVFAAECEAYPEAISLLASGRVRVEGRRVVISG